jgi:hypothetical protein
MLWHFDRLSANGVGWCAELIKPLRTEFAFPSILMLVEGRSQDARALLQAQCEREFFCVSDFEKLNSSPPRRQHILQQHRQARFNAAMRRQTRGHAAQTIFQTHLRRAARPYSGSKALMLNV